ncbi:POU class [Chamberlinius hualienensis]
MVAISPESDSAMVMNSSYPVTTLLANPTSLSGHPEQVLFTLQLPSTTNVIETNEEGKADLSQTFSLLTGAKISTGVSHQFANGGSVPLNVQGIGAVPQLTSVGMPGVQVVNSQIPGNVTVSPVAPQMNTFNQTQTAPITIQQLPQNMGVAQFFIAGGQLVQGVQGAQYLIPTSSGLTTPQQIVTLPYNQLAPGQQLLMGPNGQIIATAFNNVQTFTSPPQTVTGNNLQPQNLFTSNLPVLGISQNQSVQPVFTNSNGQIVTVSPQVVGQCPGIMQVISSSGPMGNDKVFQPIQANGNHTISPANGTIATSNATIHPNQAHIQIASSSDTIQIHSQTVQKSNASEIAQQTSSPSITSTESSTPISQTSANTVDGINLEEIKEFAKLFKIRRLSLGLTQTQVGQALNVAEGPAYSQSAICRFEKLDITPKSAQKIKPVLERWMKEAEERYKNGATHLTDFIGTEPSKKRKRRTSFTPQALEILNRHFDGSTHPSGAEMTTLADKLNYDREVVRVWFCNKRQTLKNTVKKVKAEI